MTCTQTSGHSTNRSMLSGKTLLITGGTGSFGQAVLHRLLDTDVAEIRVFSRDEKKQEDMRLSLKNERIKFCIGDVRNYESINESLSGVDYVFHAAALKQVPSCEFYPMEAFATNVLGSENVIRASINNSVSNCVLLSTDKAVYPINAMGLSKAMMEKLMVSKSRNSVGTTICATRYGNVMASRGSVIPLFIDQLKRGAPLTITDPKMTRFLMTLEESVDLVLYAFENAQPGDIFVQKAPSCTIETLALALKELFSSTSTINIIGTRHGEKLYESLVSREEMVRAIDHGRYYRIPADNRDLNYDKFFVDGDKKVSECSDYTSHNTHVCNIEETKRLLLQLSIVTSN